MDMAVTGYSRLAFTLLLFTCCCLCALFSLFFSVAALSLLTSAEETWAASLPVTLPTAGSDLTAGTAVQGPCSIDCEM